jgi:hypothetical protein
VGKLKNGAPQANWRFRFGLALFVLAGLVLVAGIALLVAGFSGGGMLLLAGPPEILCLVAAGILGKENYPSRLGEVSRFRYYTGLAGCIFNGVPLTLYAYVPELLPSGLTKISILVIADVIFFGSLLFAGGEFWERLRSLFIWEKAPLRETS